MTDHRRYMHQLSSREIKLPKKKFRLEREAVTSAIYMQCSTNRAIIYDLSDVHLQKKGSSDDVLRVR